MRILQVFISVIAISALLPAFPCVGNQIYETMSASTKLLLSQRLAAPVTMAVLSADEKELWLGASFLAELPANLPELVRKETIATILYEAKRAGLDPALIIAVMDVESNFRKFAISSAGARGLMQIMPFWLKEIGSDGHNLFDTKTNIRYGCVILRLYLDLEDGNLTRALARYNGALKKKNYANYPDAVFDAYKKWQNKLSIQGGTFYAQKNRKTD